MSVNKTLSKPAVGDKLFVVDAENVARRRGGPRLLRHVIVKSVGRKYFLAEAENGMTYKFHLEDWREENRGYESTMTLFETKKAFTDSIEEKEICRKIASAFEYGRNNAKVPIWMLRRIRDSIVGAEKGILR